MKVDACSAQGVGDRLGVFSAGCAVPAYSATFVDEARVLGRRVWGCVVCAAAAFIILDNKITNYTG